MVKIVQFWPLTKGKIEGVMVMVNFFDQWPWGKFQGVMVMVSALPPPKLLRKIAK